MKKIASCGLTTDGCFALSLSFVYNVSAFFEVNPVPPHFFPLKIPPVERPFDSQKPEKNYLAEKESSIRFWATSVSVLK